MTPLDTGARLGTYSSRVGGALVVVACIVTGCVTVAPRRDLEVSIRNGDVTLAGTLSIPGGRSLVSPVAVFVSGDGSQDRNGGGPLFPALADSLVAHGVAVLRHDDRGAGASTAPAGPPSYRALLDDTRAAIAFVRSRPGIDGRRVVLIGHSEGGKTCQVLAAEDSTIAGIVLLAGATAVNVDSLLLEQARLNPNGPAPGLIPTLERARAGGRSDGPRDLTDWMREHLEIAPRAVLPRIGCPVLILQGGADHLVREHHGAEAAALLERAGNRDVTLRTVPGLSHAFTRDGAVDPDVAHAVARWTVRIVGIDRGN